MNQQSSHRSSRTVWGMKLLLLSKGHMSLRDRLFGGGQTILEQLLEEAGQSGTGTGQTSFRKGQAQTSQRNVLVHGISRTEATAPCTALHALGTMLCRCAGEASQDPLAPNPSWQRHVMPARLVQKNRLMEEYQPLVGSLWAKLEIY